jgi:hypothetical protein
MLRENSGIFLDLINLGYIKNLGILSFEDNKDVLSLLKMILIWLNLLILMNVFFEISKY